MRKRENKTNPLFIIGIAILGIALAIIFGTSYYALRKLAFAGDRIIYGKKQSELTEEIRAELLKRPEITPVSIPSSDNLTLAGLFVKRAKPRANLLLCHGYRSAKELMYAYIDLFPDWNILLFDFRAHGQSDGSITSIGCHEYKDVIASAHALQKMTHKQHLPMIILGISMGGASTLKAAEVEPGLCDTMIIDSSYAKLDSTVLKAFSSKASLPHYPFFPIIKGMFHFFGHCDVHSMNPVKSVKSITQPILFIHSCDDAYTSPKNSIQLYANAQNPLSRLWIAPHCRHGWLHSYHSALYKHKVLKFIRRSLPQFSNI